MGSGMQKVYYLIISACVIFSLEQRATVEIGWTRMPASYCLLFQLFSQDCHMWFVGVPVSDAKHRLQPYHPSRCSPFSKAWFSPSWNKPKFALQDGPTNGLQICSNGPWSCYLFELICSFLSELPSKWGCITVGSPNAWESERTDLLLPFSWMILATTFSISPLKAGEALPCLRAADRDSLVLRACALSTLLQLEAEWLGRWWLDCLIWLCRANPYLTFIRGEWLISKPWLLLPHSLQAGSTCHSRNALVLPAE